MGRPPEPSGDTVLWLISGAIFDAAKGRAIVERTLNGPPNIIAMIDALNTLEGLLLRLQSDLQTAEEIRKLHSARSIAALKREAKRRAEEQMEND